MSWKEERRAAAAEQAAALERKKASESAKARELLLAFVRDMRAAGVEPEPLRAHVVGSSASYRTNLTGWYLRTNKSLAVDVDGNFYILGVPASLRSRLSGVQVLPSAPPLVVGQGGRDGESIPMADLLRLRRSQHG